MLRRMLLRAGLKVTRRCDGDVALADALALGAASLFCDEHAVKVAIKPAPTTVKAPRRDIELMRNLPIKKRFRLREKLHKNRT